MTTVKILDKINDFFEGYEKKTIPKGTIITFAHENPKAITHLIEGVVEQYDITPEGNKVTVNIFKPPAFFPMSWAINKTPNTYFFATLTDIQVRQAPADKVVAFLEANPDVTMDLLSRLYKGTDALLRRLVIAASGMASNRLIYELLIESYRFGENVGENEMLIKIKQGNLAARSGLARETVSRELHKLEEGHLLTKTKQGIVLNIAELEQQIGA